MFTQGIVNITHNMTTCYIMRIVLYLFLMGIVMTLLSEES